MNNALTNNALVNNALVNNALTNNKLISINKKIGTHFNKNLVLKELNRILDEIENNQEEFNEEQFNEILYEKYLVMKFIMDYGLHRPITSPSDLAKLFAENGYISSILSERPDIFSPNVQLLLFTFNSIRPITPITFKNLFLKFTHTRDYPLLRKIINLLLDYHVITSDELVNTNFENEYLNNAVRSIESSKVETRVLFETPLESDAIQSIAEFLGFSPSEYSKRFNFSKSRRVRRTRRTQRKRSRRTQRKRSRRT